MNTPTEHDDAPNGTVLDARLRRHLETTAARVPVAAGSASRARRVAHERTIRRRRVASGTAAAAMIVTLVVGVQRLSTRPAGDQRTASTLPAATAAQPGALSAVPATAGAPAFVWRVVVPDQETSITSTFDNGSSRQFPAFAVSTAPGRSNDYDTINAVVWRSDDGITWEQTGLSSPFGPGSVYNSIAAAGRLFSVATAPGAAPNDPIPVSVAIANGTTDDWNTVELPFDTADVPDVPFTVTGVERMTFAVDDGVLIGLTKVVNLNISDVVDANPSIDHDRLMGQSPEGLEVRTAACGPDEYPTTVSTIPLGHPASSTTAPAESVPPPTATEHTEAGECGSETIPWADLNVPDATIQALGGRATEFFHVSVDGEVRSVASPEPGTRLATPFGSGAPIVQAHGYFAGDSPDSSAYRFADGTWVPSPVSTVPWWSAPAYANGSMTGWAEVANNLGFVRLGDDGTVDARDVSALFPEHTMLGIEGSVVVGAGAVGVVNATHDAIAAAGGVEIARRGGYAVRMDDMRFGWFVIDAATGERVPDERIRHRNDTLQVIDEQGAAVAEFTYAEIDTVAPMQPGDTARQLVTTADGASFAVESIAELAGISDGQISHVGRVSSDGTQVFVTVSLNDRYPDGTPKQLILVGTPAG